MLMESGGNNTGKKKPREITFPILPAYENLDFNGVKLCKASNIP